MVLKSQLPIRRLVLYILRDAKPSLYHYVVFFLHALKAEGMDVVVYGVPDDASEARRVLEALGAEAVVAPVVADGMDAYRDTLSRIGMDRLEKYDELVLLDSTLYGPLYPLRPVFSEMARRNLDAWGLVLRRGFQEGSMAGWPVQVYPAFFCLRNSVWRDPAFMNAFTPRDNRTATFDSLAQWLEDKGFACDAYIREDECLGEAYGNMVFLAGELIEKYRCPVIDRAVFTTDYLSRLDSTVGETAVDVMRLIGQRTDYDPDLIWENLIGTMHMSELKDSMQLNRILPKDWSCPSDKAQAMRTALFMHVYFADLIDEYIRYAMSMPEDADIYFITADDQIRELLAKREQVFSPRKLRVLAAENRGRDVSALLVSAAPYVMDYDLVCFAHDKKSTQTSPRTVGRSFAYQCMENVLGSNHYVNNVICTFAREGRMGMLVPPYPIHDGYFGTISREWSENYSNALALAAEIGIDVPMDPEHPPVAPYGTMFWFRPKALAPLYRKAWRFQDFPAEPNGVDGTLIHAIERLYGFSAQSEGYYVAWGMTADFAAIYETSLYYSLRQITSRLFDIYGSGSLPRILRMLSQEESFIAVAHRLIKKNLAEPLLKTLKRYQKKD